MPGQSAFICGIGLFSPVGGCTAQTATSVRAGISRYAESAVCNKHFMKMTMAMVPEEDLPVLTERADALPGLTARQRRMLRLAGPALEEALQPLPDGERVPLFLAGPEQLPGRPEPVHEAFLDHLLAQAVVPIDRHCTKLLAKGRAGGLAVVKYALQMFAEGSGDLALVGGVDTYLDLYLLGTLDRDNRVLAPGVMDGFAPGEAAAFLLLCSEAGAARVGARSRVRIGAPGLALEPGHRFSKAPCRGEGLDQAIKGALAGFIGTPVRTVYASLNGENVGAKEWGVAVLRSAAAIDPGFRMIHPADCFGDVGAAFGPMLLGLAAVALEEGYVQGPCLAWCASDGAPRAAVCVSIA
jgi:3-oxoacyl-[acyl-carrier-protein] synthase I